MFRTYVALLDSSEVDRFRLWKRRLEWLESNCWESALVTRQAISSRAGSGSGPDRFISTCPKHPRVVACFAAPRNAGWAPACPTGRRMVVDTHQPRGWVLCTSQAVDPVRFEPWIEDLSVPNFSCKRSSSCSRMFCWSSTWGLASNVSLLELMLSAFCRLGSRMKICTSNLMNPIKKDSQSFSFFASHSFSSKEKKSGS